MVGDPMADHVRSALISLFACLTLPGCGSSSSDAPAPVSSDDASTADAASDADLTTVDGAIDAAADTGSVGDTGTQNDAGTSVDAADLCANLPTNAAPTITDSVVSSAYPAATAATGGVIESGTYYQTQHIYYQPSSTPSHTWNGTMAIDATANTSVANISRDGSVFQQTGERFTTSGSSFNVTLVCPASSAGTTATFAYTYAAGTLTIYADADKTATVFQKQ
jgi:hypothetical protein